MCKYDMWDHMASLFSGSFPHHFQCMLFSAQFRQCGIMEKGAWHLARQNCIWVLTPPITNYDRGQVTYSYLENGPNHINYLLMLYKWINLSYHKINTKHTYTFSTSTFIVTALFVYDSLRVLFWGLLSCLKWFKANINHLSYAEQHNGLGYSSAHSPGSITY